MASGVILYTVSQFILAPMIGDGYPHFLHVMAFLFVINVIVMLVIGKMYPRQTDYIQEYTQQVDITPWRYVKIAGALVVIIVVSTYVYFS